MKININKSYIKLGLITIFVVLILAVGLFVQTQNNKINQTISQDQQQPQVTVNKVNELFTYKGEERKDALTVLKVKAKIEQDNSGMVVSINGRKSSSSAREYWAFYINGELSQVGPSDYQTKNEDLLEWKIEKY